MSPPARIVVLHHLGVDEPHFDLMIQPTAGAALLTWRCPAWPPEAGGELTRLRDHRAQYLDYEGPISDDRGNVLRIFAASCEAAIAPERIDLTNFVPPQPFARLTIDHESGTRWRIAAVD